METNALALDSEERAAELCTDLDLGDEARELLQPEDIARQFVHRLIDQRLLFDAIRVVARGLPKPVAVKWACACARPVLADPPGERETACLEAAERWVAEPTEENRRSAAEAVGASEFDTPAAWAAAAAGWSGGSLAPPELPAVPPPDYLTAHAVAGSVGLAAASVPEEVEARQVAFLQAGLDLADGLAAERKS